MEKIKKWLIKNSIWLLLIVLFTLCTNGIYKMYFVDTEDCTACGKCKQVCPNRAIILEQEAYYNVKSEKCTGCGTCVDECEYNAVKLPYRSKFLVDQSKCTGCGFCYNVCENSAILGSFRQFIIDNSDRYVNVVESV